MQCSYRISSPLSSLWFKPGHFASFGASKDGGLIGLA